MSLNATDIVVLIVVAALVIGVTARLIHRKRTVGFTCSCGVCNGCSKCPGHAEHSGKTH